MLHESMAGQAEGACGLQVVFAVGVPVCITWLACNRMHSAAMYCLLHASEFDSPRCRSQVIVMVA